MDPRRRMSKALYFSSASLSAFLEFSLGYPSLLRSISVLTSLYPHCELCLPLNGGNGLFNNFPTAHG